MVPSILGCHQSMSLARQFAGSAQSTILSTLVYHSSVFMSKRRLFDKFGELCISSMLQDAFGDLLLVPNSKSTERLSERRAEGLAATAFVC